MSAFLFYKVERIIRSRVHFKANLNFVRDKSTSILGTKKPLGLPRRTWLGQPNNNRMSYGRLIDTMPCWLGLNLIKNCHKSCICWFREIIDGFHGCEVKISRSSRPYLTIGTIQSTRVWEIRAPRGHHVQSGHVIHYFDWLKFETILKP